MPRTVASPLVPVAITDLAALPLILTLNEIAGIYRISPSTIRRALQRGTFRPQPWDHYPYRWNRDDVAADLKRRRDEHTRRAHGFAATRAKRPAKAPLTPRRSPRRAS
jgi:hypothetical protein